MPRDELPSGTVTFLFTDIEGSTKLLHELGAEAYAEALAEHRRLIREAFQRHGGVEVDTQGDAFFIAFPSATGALEAAAESQEGLASGSIGVRMGLHTGTPHLTDEGYVGQVVHEGARIAAVGHGGQVLLSAPTLALAQVEVTDLGEHRLKDIEGAFAIFQLGAGRFPPLKTIFNTNLPHPASSFVGRGEEVSEVVALLRGGARLLTLTGPGGTGKTRLAIEAASELVSRFKAGVYWVELAPLRDPALVADAIAQTLGATGDLAGHIAERDLLLVLDNLEQVIEAAPRLASLVETCPNLRLLITSRELLRVRGEVEFPVSPLAEPDAVQLFCARARTEPKEAVRALCRALDNLPLAIELAAARASSLSPAQILERLSGRLDLLKGGRDADVRHQTLRATIAWSFELLSPEERQLFARLSVFVGGCSLGSAEQVADADVDTLGSLVDKSLLRHTGERFWMLETIRGYASERLEETDDAAAIAERHAEHFLVFAEEVEPHLFEPHSAPWLERLEVEHDNLRATLDRLEETGDTEAVLRVAGALADFWGTKGHLTEGRRRLEGALRTDQRPSAARARALNGASDLANGIGDAAKARMWAEEGLTANRSLGHTRGTADALYVLGVAIANDGDFAQARDLFEESVELFRDLGDERGTLEAINTLAWANKGLGDLARARALMEDSLRRARATGDEHIQAVSLEVLAPYAVEDGRVDDALSMLDEAYRLNRAMGDAFRIAGVVCRFAQVLAAGGRVETAARVLSSGTVLLEEIGAAPAWIAKENEDARAIIVRQLGEAAFAEAWEAGKALTADEAVTLALGPVT